MQMDLNFILQQIEMFSIQIKSYPFIVSANKFFQLDNKLTITVWFLVFAFEYVCN